MMIVFMSIKDNLSKKNTSLLLMTALIIGIIVVITQLASAGSQKNENPSIQNIISNDSSKIKSIINNRWNIIIKIHPFI